MVSSSVSLTSGKAHVWGLAVAAAMAGLGAIPAAANANEIGVQFVGGKTALTASQTAGVTGVAQDNWNPITTTVTNAPLNDNTGSVITATLSVTPYQGYFAGNLNDGVPADAILTSGELYNTWPDTGSGGYQGTNITVSNIPYAHYDLYVPAAIDATGRAETIEVTPTGGSASYQSFTTAALTAWTPATSNWNGSGTAPTLANANYAEFTGLTATGFTMLFGAPGNGAINGLQIVAVAVPEPATLGLMGLSGLGILLLGRKRKTV